MPRDRIMGLMSVNRSLTSLGSESRQLQLPTMTQFPKLDHKHSRPTPISAREGLVVIGGAAGALPEMTTDVIDVAVGYAVENVKRERGEPRPTACLSLGRLVVRMLGYSHRAVRP